MGSERQMILKMLQEGRINVEEAEGLIAALDRAEASRSGPRPGTEEAHDRPRPRPEPGMDFGDLGRSIRDAAKGFADGMRKLAEEVPWGTGLGDWFRQAAGGAKVTVEREVSIPVEGGDGPKTLSFSGTSGAVTVRGSDDSRISGKAFLAVTGFDESSAREIGNTVEVIAERRGDAVELSFRSSRRPGEPLTLGPRPHVERLELTVPRRLGVRLQTASGDITVASVEGDVAVTTASGGIALSGLAGAVTAQSASGAIDVASSRPAALEARSASGSLGVAISPPRGATVRLETASGNIELRIDRDACAHIEAVSLSGEVTATAPLRIEELTRSRVAGVLNSPDGSVKAKSMSGTIRIETLQP
jgi:hypothetical protein